MKKNFLNKIPAVIILFFAFFSTTFAINSIALWTYPDIPNSDVATDVNTTGARILNQEYLSLNNSGNLVQTYAYSPEKVNGLRAISDELYCTVSGGIHGMRELFTAGMDRANNQKLDQFLTGVVDFTVNNNITGIDIDFEKFGDWNIGDWNNFKIFLQLLGDDLHAQGKKLQIDGPAIPNQRYQNYFKWKYEELPESSIDRIVVMAYDEMYDNGGTNPVANLDFVKESAQWLKNKISDDSKIVIGLNAYGFRTVNGNIWNVKVMTKKQIVAAHNPNTTPYVRKGGAEWHYFDGTDHFWYSDSESIEQKKAQVDSVGLNKVSFWHAGGENFKFGIVTPPAPTPTCNYTYGNWTPEICADGTQSRTETKNPAECINGIKQEKTRTCTIPNPEPENPTGPEDTPTCNYTYGNWTPEICADGTQSRTETKNPAVCIGGVRQEKTRTCTIPVIEPESPTPKQNCTFSGQNINHGAGLQLYEKSTVPYGQTCRYQLRTCNNGFLNGSYTHASCTVDEPVVSNPNTGGPVSGGTPSSRSGGSGRGSRSKKKYVCNDVSAINYSARGTHRKSVCKYNEKKVQEKLIEKKEEVLDEKTIKINDTALENSPQKISGNVCPSNLILSQNLKSPAYGKKYIRNGKYNWYTKGIVREAHILQKHLNRLKFNAGVVDGVIGPKTRAAILKMQKHLGTVQDGYVGPKTRKLLNKSC